MTWVSHLSGENKQQGKVQGPGCDFGTRRNETAVISINQGSINGQCQMDDGAARQLLTKNRMFSNMSICMEKSRCLDETRY